MKRPVNRCSPRMISARVFVTGFVLAVGFVVFVRFAEKCNGQGTLQPLLITFDGPPLQPPITASLVQQYDESGMRFTPTDLGDGFVRVGTDPVPGRPDNGTIYLQASLGDTLRFSFTNGSVFNLDAVDLTEYSIVRSNATAVHFVGYRHDGTTVTTDLITAGINDGIRPLFQTFTFGKEFTDLDRVEIPTWSWSLDNLVVSRNVPEPATWGLLLLGGLTLLARRRFNSHRRC